VDTTDSANRREQLLEQLGIQAEELRSSEGWVAWLNFARRFRHYSLGNQLLVQAQCPNATFVAGFRTWQSFGRFVKKGERGIAILAPMVRRAKDDEMPNVSDGKVLMGFRVAYVFDIHQTEGEEVPVVPNPDTYVPDEALLEQLILAARRADIRVETVSEAPAGVLGWWSGVDQTITLVDNQDLASKTCTLLHELAHAFDAACLDPREDRAERELVAESAAYLVGTEMGIEMREQSAHYVMTWGATGERLLELADEVLSVTNRLGVLASELPLPLAG
jgi:antirestriction protein ArdC